MEYFDAKTDLSLPCSYMVEVFSISASNSHFIKVITRIRSDCGLLKRYINVIKVVQCQVLSCMLNKRTGTGNTCNQERNKHVS